MQHYFNIRIMINSLTSPSDLDATLLAKPLDPSDVNHLLHACYTRKKELFCDFLPVILNHGGNINQFDQPSQGKTIFMSACSAGEVEIVRKMLQYQVNLALKDAEGENVVILSLNSYEQHKDNALKILSLILEKDPQLADSEFGHKSALILAVEKNNKEIVRILLDKGANPNYSCGDTQDTPMHVVVRKLKKKGDALEIAKMLLEKKVNLNVRNKQGRLATDHQEWQVKQILEQLIASTRDSPRKRSNHDVSKQILKSNNKMIKNLAKIPLRLNNRNDEETTIEEALGHYEERLLKQIKKLQEQKRRREDEIKKLEEQRKLELERSSDWVIPNSVLKYYLEEQIKVFSKQIEEHNKEDKQHFDHLIGLISQSLEKQLSIQIKVYGSFATRLCLKESDIDVVIVSNTPLESHSASVDLLERVDKKLEELEFIESSKFIKSATFPVIKVTCNSEYRFKKIDITLQNPSHNGLDSVEIIRQYIELYEELRPLTFVLKTFIYSSNLADTYQGGLSSYGLILMIVALLQKEHMLKKPDEKLMVSELLIKFLWFYGYEVDYICKGIYVENPVDVRNRVPYKGPLFLLTDSMYQMIDLTPKLMLVDPLHIENNVGRSTHQIKLIQKAFCSGYTSIHMNYSCQNLGCEYREGVQKAEVPKEVETKHLRPCCILKRMFECAKSFGM